MALLRSDWNEWQHAIQLWAMSSGATSWLIDLEPFEPVKVAGIVQRIRIDPFEGVVEATIADGTGSALARWSTSDGVTQLPVIPGKAVLLEGLGPRSQDGRVVLVDPILEVIPAPWSEATDHE